MAKSADRAVVDVNAPRRVGAARRCSAGIASADPMSVCGRVKRQRTIGKGNLLLDDSVASLATATEYDALRSDDDVLLPAYSGDKHVFF